MGPTPSTAAWVALAALIIVLRPWQTTRPESLAEQGERSAARWLIVPAALVALVPIALEAGRGDWQAAGWWALAAPAVVSVLVRVFGAPILIAWRYPKDATDAGSEVWSLLAFPVVALTVTALVARAAGADEPLAAALALVTGSLAWELVRHQASAATTSLRDT